MKACVAHWGLCIHTEHVWKAIGSPSLVERSAQPGAKAFDRSCSCHHVNPGMDRTLRKQARAKRSHSCPSLATCLWICSCACICTICTYIYLHKCNSDCKDASVITVNLRLCAELSLTIWAWMPISAFDFYPTEPRVS